MHFRKLRKTSARHGVSRGILEILQGSFHSDPSSQCLEKTRLASRILSSPCSVGCPADVDVDLDGGASEGAASARCGASPSVEAKQWKCGTENYEPSKKLGHVPYHVESPKCPKNAKASSHTSPSIGVPQYVHCMS